MPGNRYYAAAHGAPLTYVQVFVDMQLARKPAHGKIMESALVGNLFVMFLVCVHVMATFIFSDTVLILVMHVDVMGMRGGEGVRSSFIIVGNLHMYF